MKVSEVTNYTDYILLISGRSERHLKTILEHILLTMKKEGEIPLGVEGFVYTGWILLDFNDVIVHIFLEPIREFYDIEGIWLDVPKENLSVRDASVEGEASGKADTTLI